MTRRQRKYLEPNPDKPSIIQQYGKSDKRSGPSAAGVAATAAIAVTVAVAVDAAVQQSHQPNVDTNQTDQAGSQGRQQQQAVAPVPEGSQGQKLQTAPPAEVVDVADEGVGSGSAVVAIDVDEGLEDKELASKRSLPEPMVVDLPPTSPATPGASDVALNVQPRKRKGWARFLNGRAQATVDGVPASSAGETSTSSNATATSEVTKTARKLCKTLSEAVDEVAKPEPTLTLTSGATLLDDVMSVYAAKLSCKALSDMKKNSGFFPQRSS